MMTITATNFGTDGLSAIIAPVVRRHSFTEKASRLGATIDKLSEDPLSFGQMRSAIGYGLNCGNACSAYAR